MLLQKGFHPNNWRLFEIDVINRWPSCFWWQELTFCADAPPISNEPTVCELWPLLKTPLTLHNGVKKFKKTHLNVWWDSLKCFKVIFNEILHLNKNVTTYCHLIYTFCKPNDNQSSNFGLFDLIKNNL